MIESLRISNFENHKDTFVDFSDGLNVLAGDSASGKSAIRRALQFVIYNTFKKSQISWWAVNAKGTQTEETRVILTLTNGTVIERVKNARENLYILNGEKPLEAVGSSVPDIIQEALNFSDINCQKQMEAPFLVSESAAEVARIFNRVVNLEDADYYQSAVESKRQQCNKELKVTATSIENIKGELAQLTWIEAAENWASVIFNFERDNRAIGTILEHIKQSLVSYDREQEKLSQCDTIEVAEDLVASITNTLKKSEECSVFVQHLTSSIDAYKGYMDDIVDCNIMVSADKLIRQITRMVEEQKLLQETKAYLEGSLEKYIVSESDWKALAKELKPLETELTLVTQCPLCGSTLHDPKVIF